MSSFQLRSLSDLNVKHNSQKNQFFVELGSDKAVLEYKEVKPGLLDLYHTEVPNQLRGKGIAQMLAKEAFDYMVKNNIKMIVSCTYLQKYLKDNPNEEYTKQVFENKH
ncbi:protein NATD1-like isoform X2 [Oppia nitens]|nr:protein NATD1-like isoform X2 [Oppia nitens]